MLTPSDFPDFLDLWEASARSSFWTYVPGKGVQSVGELLQNEPPEINVFFGFHSFHYLNPEMVGANAAPNPPSTRAGGLDYSNLHKLPQANVGLSTTWL